MATTVTEVLLQKVVPGVQRGKTLLDNHKQKVRGAIRLRTSEQHEGRVGTGIEAAR